MNKYWGTFIVMAILFSCKEDKPMATAKEITFQKEKVEKVITKQFGFNLDQFKVKIDTVKNGDSFEELMLEHKVDYPKIFKISQDFKDTFDVRRIRVGNPYMILSSKDTSETTQIFIYENDAINYTVIDLRIA